MMTLEEAGTSIFEKFAAQDPAIVASFQELGRETWVLTMTLALIDNGAAGLAAKIHQALVLGIMIGSTMER